MFNELESLLKGILFLKGNSFVKKLKLSNILDRLKEQLCVFPEHPNDDAPDSLSSAVEIIKKVHSQGDFKFKRVKSRKLGGLL